MKLNKKQGRFLDGIISQWLKNGTVTAEIADVLKNSYSVRAFDFKRLAKYSFWSAIVCAIIAVAAIFADDALFYLIKRFFTSSNTVLCIIFAVLAAAAFFFGLKRRGRKPEKIFSNEAIIFFGVLLTAVSIIYFGRAIDIIFVHFSILFLLSTVIYAVLAFWFPSKLVWLFTLVSLGAWFGTETGYVSGWGMYYLGMNYPLRFVFFGLALVGASFAFRKIKILLEFRKLTLSIGLLYLFIALWILSIFGNYGDMRSWYDVKQYELLHWGILFAIAAIGAIVYGLKQDDSTYRSFGITFLFINLYTKYFEYFWDTLHKAIFFLVLAISFFFVGSRAEKIWNMEFIRKPGKSKNLQDDKSSNNDFGGK